MASSSQIRAWWKSYECATSKMVRVDFPGPAGPNQWSLLVADKSAPIWEAVADIMRTEPYLFRESAGGTYKCRPPSLHAYGLAIDLNPSVNPFDCPMRTDMPESFIRRMEGIRANGKQALQWGGRWPCENPPDPMHFQINVAPADCKNVTWDQGDDMASSAQKILVDFFYNLDPENFTGDPNVWHTLDENDPQWGTDFRPAAGRAGQKLFLKTKNLPNNYQPGSGGTIDQVARDTANAAQNGVDNLRAHLRQS
jgi:hypothetical protein